MEKQKTIKDTIHFSGKGIHTGVFTNMTLIPAKENNGIVFIRTDKDNIRVKAIVENIYSTERSTNLKKNNVFVKTVEHVLAAIVGNNIDNIDILIDNEEVPILDGSAKEFTEKITHVGIKEQKSYKYTYNIEKEIYYKDEESGTEIIVTPNDQYSINVTIDYNSRTLGIQKSNLSSLKYFNIEIASSRTFCFLHELELMLENNLIKGGDINNAIVIVENKIDKRKLSNFAKVFKKNDIQLTESGILNNLKLRYKNEAARHKLLDVIGDLALIGFSIKGKVVAIKPGHTHNINLQKN